MHYLIGVILPFKYSGDKLYEAIDAILKPWDENGGEDGNENGRWDWWQLGGRWTGIWSDYEPRQDPANHESCWLCTGTGMRMDEIGQEYRAKVPEYTCNGCSEGPRPGVALKWPTQWVPRPDTDVIAVRTLLDLPNAQLPHAIAAAPDTWLEAETWTGSEFVKCADWSATAHEALQNWRGCYLAAVDIHS